MSAEAEKYKNEMFKIHSGDHPLGEKGDKVKESRIIASSARRDGARWTREELSTVIHTMPPTSNEELAALLGRGTGAINNIKKYVRNILIYENNFGYKEGKRDPRQATFWQVYDILQECGIFDWPMKDKEDMARYLPGRQSEFSRAAKYIARNT